MVAAAYAKDLLLQILPTKVKAERRIADIVSAITDVKEKVEDMSKDVHKLLHGQDDQKHQAILKWLTPVDYAQQHNDFISRRQRGTGEWMLESAEFQAWLNADKQTLFCPGIPGAGKTIITAIVIDYLQSKFRDNQSIGIAYIYCNFRRKDQQKAEDLFASLLKQLAPSQPQRVKDLYNQHKKRGTRPNFDEISKTLRSVAAIYSRLFIVVDALDEYQISDDNRARFLKEIFELQDFSGANIFATSRPSREISTLFSKGLSRTISATDGDILTYLNDKITCRQSDIIDDGMRGMVRRRVIEAADGMFLLAQLHTETLLSKLTKGHLKQALQALGKGMEGLDRTYDQAMERIADQGHEAETLAKKILIWIIHSKRPLSTLELRHALAVEKSSTALDTDFLLSPKLMLSLCAGLVTFDEESSIIRLVHYTTQEYFERTQKRWFPEAESEITMSCVKYLLFDAFKSGPCLTDAEFEQRLQSNPLYEYAAHNWGNHARKSSTPYEGVTKFLESKVHVEASSQAMMVMKRYSSHTNYSQEVPRNTTGLHLAACFGLKEAVGALMELNHDPNLTDTYSRTTLWWASREGHEAVVELLLASGNVDPTIKDNKGRTPLSWAARYGHMRIVELLLASDKVDPNVKDNFYGQTPLAWAAENGQEDVVRLLLQSERVDPNAKDNYFGRVPLSWAAAEGHEAVVELLLASGNVDQTIRDNKSRTPLSWATEKGYGAIIKLLLKDAAGQNLEGELWRAIMKGLDTIVKLLLENGVDPNAKDGDGQKPLSWATEKRDKAIVRVLLENDADPNIMDNDGRTPLSRAAEGERGAIVELLLENGADPNIMDKDGRTPLSRAAENNHGDNVRLLLGRGADPNIMDNDGRTPPLLAVGQRHEAIVKLLLERGADLNIMDKDGRTPLSRAAEDEHGDYVKLLLENGADPNIMDNDGRTPLSRAAGGWNPNIMDKDGRTPLSRAAENKHGDNVKLLLERGADPNT
ncbi:hypothetical protein BFJ63_vAg16371 [Fusarium oxysporum f. sp. narcissi]|uniref:protein S-acyltransferase n=1 Tax=Fusarium oxysporum f. sp. narcissi TaxID=451672 RepID=A0A4V1RY86_FUSOX|nr:hypothetical protein BFJ63_vAg16371 [Fusarium oxysporum f. sp. narcissi]